MILRTDVRYVSICRIRDKLIDSIKKTFISIYNKAFLINYKTKNVSVYRKLQDMSVNKIRKVVE